MKTTNPSIPIASPMTGEEEWQAMKAPILSGWLTQGTQVAEFERSFAERHGVPFAVATTSCTTALHLALASLGIGPGDEVIVPAFTWVATANVVLYCGATPVLADVDPVTMNLDPAEAGARVTSRTRAVVPVHLFGLCAAMDELARQIGDIPLVEDAACAVGAEFRGRPAGSLGQVAAFSFHPRKIITTGEGGMLTTKDEALAARAVCMRNHGASVPEEVRHSSSRAFELPEFRLLGFNYRMSDLLAAVGRVQLTKLDAFIEERARWASYYEEQLAGIEWLKTPVAKDGWTHSWQAYVCRVDGSRAPMSRDEIMQRLQDVGVSTRPGTHAVHLLDYYRERFGFHEDDFPNSRDCARDTLALPLHNKMTEDNFSYVVEAIRNLG